MNLDKFYQFMNEDWKQKIYEWWNNISPVSRKSFLWIFGIINLVFIWHTITFFWGNHDWWQIKNGVYVGWSLWDGRWGAGVIQQITGGDILPVWNNLFCFAGFSLAMVFLAKYWELPKNTFIYTMFGLFIVLMPYTPPWLQYVRSETHFWNVFLVIFSLYICSFKKWWLYCLAFLLLLFCLGCYAAILPLMFIVFLGRCLLDVWFDNKTLHQLIKDRMPTMFIILLSFIVFAISWSIMKHFCIDTSYTTVQTTTIQTLFNNFMYIHEGIKDSFFHELPYIPTWFKKLLGLAIPIVVLLMTKLSNKQVFLIIPIFLGILVSTQTTDLLSVVDYSKQLRIEFWAMPYTYALFWAILLRWGKCWENIAILFMCVAIYFSGLQDIRDQKVKYFDKLRDTRIFEDVITRIKANPEFDSMNKYNVLMVGDVYSNRKITTFDKYNSYMTWSNTWAPFMPKWNAHDYINFYETVPYVNVSYSEYSSEDLTDDILKKLDIKYLLNDAKVYPNPNCTHVDKQHIYIIFDQTELDELRKRIKNLNLK